MKISINNQPARCPAIPKYSFTPRTSTKASVQNMRSEDKRKPTMVSNKKFEAINDNIIQNNKKLNSLIENYNKFLDKYENEGFKKAKVIECLQKEVEKLEEDIYKPFKTTRITPLFLDATESFEMDKPKARGYKISETGKRKSEINKNANVVNNLLSSNNDKLYQYLVTANLLEDDNSNKVAKKQVDEIKKIEKTVNQQNYFLMFLMDKNLPTAPKKSEFDSEEIVDKLINIQNKQAGGTLKKNKKTKQASENKMKEIHNFLNQNLLKNYQLLCNVTSKNGNKPQIPIFMPTTMLKTRI